MHKARSLFEKFEYEPVENPDWGYARNVRAALLTPSAEWVQSVCSFPFEVNGKTFISPNRDYPYEGLVAYHAGENWKFIDCIGLSLLRQNGEQLSLTASTVKITPWRVDYWYEGEVPVLVSYYLDSQNSPELLTGCVEFYFPRGLAYDSDRVVALIQPFVDIRHMWASSSFENYRLTNEKAGRIHISNYNRVLSFFFPEGHLSVFDRPEILNWHYKLGTGSRTEHLNEQQQEETIFVAERKNVAAFFGFQAATLSEQKSVKLYFSASLNTTKTNFFLPDLQKNSDESKRKDQSDIQTIVDTFPISETIDFREAIWARIVALTKFKTYIYFAESEKYIRVPHAGAWWFKTPWYRDVFEGLLNSFETLMRLPQEGDDIREVILSALSLQDKTSGLILNKIPEFTTLQAAYNSCDATLLCFMLANAYFRKTKDPDFALRVLDCVGTAISSFKTNGHCSEFDGPPAIDETTGLLLCAPHHSWIDTRARSVQCAGSTLGQLPNRLSVQFLENLCERMSNVEVIASSPCFFLPEINAQWIAVLDGTIQMIDLINEERPSAVFDDLRIKTDALVTNAKRHFKPLFWNENKGYLFNAVFEDKSIKDDIECEAGVAAAAILAESVINRDEPVFTRDELQSIWNCTEQTLLARRRLIKYGDEFLPFGILTKNEEQGVYYGDDQYHSDMIWPRSTPYLIKLLRMLDKDSTARDILINNLDHQMTECAIFYNQELFSPALGHNAHRTRTSQNPVPVKNPIQFWSQWCDAYLEVFGEEE